MMNSKKILFLGTHGQHNIGDELLLETFLAQLGEQHNYMINSYDPEFTRAQLADKYNVDVFHTTTEKMQLPTRIWKADLLFFGGGSVLKELYASVGRNQYSTLLMVLVIVLFARLIARKPIIMSNIGVGPVHSRFGLLLVKLILGQVTYVSVRDQRSYDTCRQGGISTRKLVLVPDAVFVTDPQSLGNVRSVDKTGSEPLKIALNLNYNIENPENWESFLTNLAFALNAIGAEKDLEIHALPMQSHFNPQNDLHVLRSFREQVPALKVILHEPATAQDIAEILCECDIVVAERLHTRVLSSILQKPFVALIYDVKVQQLTQFLEMERLAIDINRPFEAAELADNIIEALDRKQDIAKHLTQQASQAAEQLHGYFNHVNEQLLSVSSS